MNDRLRQILDSTRVRIDALDADRMAELRQQAEAMPPPRSLSMALRRPAKGTGQAADLRVIGEIKRRSPSAGDIYEDLDVAATARELAAAGCAAISVLTEPEFFGGALENLELARAAVDLPLLRKDFILDRRQIVEARAHGADAVLLLAAALEDEQFETCVAEAQRWGLEVLAEAHGEDEMRRLVELDVPILGLNARDLHTFEVDLSRVLEWAPHAGDRVVVAESGILVREDARKVIAAPVDAALIGEGLMRGGRPAQAYRELFGAPSSAA